MTVEQRFWPKVDKNGPTPLHRPELGPCWLWTAGLNVHGYGRIWADGKARYAHHISWELANGQPIPDGLEHDHLCRVRRCVNVSHLDPVAHVENVRRGLGSGFQRNAAKTHCPHGHAYAGENLYVAPDGRRSCRACRRGNVQRYLAKREVG